MQHADETALPNTAKQAKVSASGMSYKGRVKNGVVVLPPEAKLAEGTEVEVTPTEVEATDPFLKARRSRSRVPTGQKISR